MGDHSREEAIAVARELCLRLKPVTERLIVAGSLRRRKDRVGDVEILYLPRYEERQIDLFHAGLVDVTEEAIAASVNSGALRKRSNPAGRAVGWGPLNKFAVHGASGIAVDLFVTTSAAWWNYLVCRTGSAEMNRRIAAAACDKGFRWNPYGTGFTSEATGVEVPMGSEKDVFEFVGLPYLEPWQR